MLWPESGFFKKVQLKTKGNYSLPETVTFDDKIKDFPKSKAEYQEMYFNITQLDLNATEYNSIRNIGKIWQDL